MTTNRDSGAPLLQAVAERIIARHLTRGFSRDVKIVSELVTFRGPGIDVGYTTSDGARRTVKVKADAYCGTDSGKIDDRALAFYRADTRAFAFESVANTATREPGWMLGSDADELFYYYLALGQEEDEVRALLGEPDEVFFSELLVEHDDLVVLPMAEARRWFAQNADAYPPRPIFLGSTPAWYRLVPRAVVQSQLPGVRIVGPVFASLALR